MKSAENTKTPEAQLQALGLILPAAPPAPVGAFCNVRISGTLAYVSGQGPVKADGRLHTGKVGAEVSTAEAREHAQLVALNILSALREHVGSLDNIKGVVKLLGLVNAVPEFSEHPFVIDGASEILAQIFSANGIHARSAFGVSSLPNQITVEIEAIFELFEVN